MDPECGARRLAAYFGVDCLACSQVLLMGERELLNNQPVWLSNGCVGCWWSEPLNFYLFWEFTTLICQFFQGNSLDRMGLGHNADTGPPFLTFLVFCAMKLVRPVFWWVVQRRQTLGTRSDEN